MTRVLSAATRGVIPIVPTPFRDDGAIEFADVARLVDYYEACGVVGLTILGVMGEANKLTWDETLQLVRAFLQCSAGRLPILVGATAPSLSTAAQLGTIAVGEGAAGVMLQPGVGLADGAPVVDYFAKYIERTAGAVPICVQDFPQSSGVPTSVETWQLLSRLEPIFMLKHEPPAGLQKLTGIRAAEAAGTARRVAILTSNNALYLSEELARGADGAMVGVAYTDLVVQVCRWFWEGDEERANDLYDALLPIARHEAQGAFGLAIRKEVLRRRGGLSTSTVRYPGATLQPTDLAELDRLCNRLRNRLAEIGI